MAIDAKSLTNRDGLFRDFSRSERSRKIRAAGLVLPLVLFLSVIFLGPLAVFLSRSVDDGLVGPVLPNTIGALAGWDGKAMPSEAVFAALILDLKGVSSPQLVARAATRLNYALPSARTLLTATRTKLLRDEKKGSAQETLLAISPEWGRPTIWSAIWQARGPQSAFYLLDALDLQHDSTGRIELVPENERVFLQVIQRTFVISLSVTFIVLIIGFPLSYLIANAAPATTHVLMFVVMLSFWTSALVRTLSWMVLLQRQGILNDFFLRVGFVDEPLALLYSRGAVYLGLVHIFLPYMILPLYSVMCSVQKPQLRAAASLGATPALVFRKIYMPQVAPGVAAGCLLVFIQCLGVFVTPALLGGLSDQGLAYMVAYYVNQTLNWGLAASLSIMLLISVAVCYWVFRQLTDATRAGLA